MKVYNINFYNLFSFHYYNKFGWIRLFGKGLKFKDTSIHDLFFSERNGYSKGLRIGNWYISCLHNNFFYKDKIIEPTKEQITDAIVRNLHNNLKNK